MGGVTEAPSKGGKKSMNVELNLVPFIDLMTVCVTFLLLTAVWTQTNRISIDQSVAKPKPNQPQQEQPKRLTVMVGRDGYSVRWSEDPKAESIPKAGNGKYNADGLKAKLKEWLDAKRFKTDQKVMVAPEDTMPYSEMIAAMDACNQVGLMNIMVADAASVIGEMM